MKVFVELEEINILCIFILINIEHLSKFGEIQDNIEKNSSFITLGFNFEKES